jgi:hypothetical protein
MHKKVGSNWLGPVLLSCKFSLNRNRKKDRTAVQSSPVTGFFRFDGLDL